MTFTLPELIALAAVILVIGFLVHKYLPASAVAKAETAVIADVRKIAPTIDAIGMQALADAEMWITDTSSKDAAIARLQAEKAAIVAAARAHVAKVLAALPPV